MASILATPRFNKEVKRLIKKFPSLKNEIEGLRDQLFLNPQFGIPLGQDFYKIRLAIRSKGKGKSGSARVITFVKVVDETVYLVTIYDKSEQTDMDISELIGLV
jgi:mRNA-degrading endonuclease RelE of RelBE toxin-antitoxin system